MLKYQIPGEEFHGQGRTGELDEENRPQANGNKFQFKAQRRLSHVDKYSSRLGTHRAFEHSVTVSTGPGRGDRVFVS